MDRNKYVKVQLRDFHLGRALRFDVYDGNRRLIKQKGDVLHTQAELEAMLSSGAYRRANEPRLVDSTAQLANRLAQESLSTLRGDGASAETGRSGIVSLDQTQVRIGEQIRMQVPGDGAKYAVRLIGYLKNQGIVVTEPEADGAAVILREGQSLDCWFFSKLSVYAFSTSVIRQTVVPYPVLHLAYPREIRVHEVRQSQRVNCDLIGVVEPVDGGTQSAVRLLDIGVSGVRIQARWVLGEVGTRVRLKFKLSIQGLDVYIDVIGEIRSIGEIRGEQAGQYQCGLRLVDLDEKMRLALMAYMFQRMNDN